MLYQTAAPASEILALNVEDPDLEHRRAPVRSKGGDTEFVRAVLAAALSRSAVLTMSRPGEAVLGRPE